MNRFFSRLISTTVLLGSVSLTAAAAHAGEMTLYTDDNFGGRSVTLRGATPDLVQFGFNDRTSSVIVRSGTWELCQHAGFQGHCITLQRGEYRQLQGFNDQVSSAREVGGRDDRYDRDDRRDDHRNDRDDRDDRRGDRGDRGDRGGYGRPEPIVLFARAGFDGRRVELQGNVRTLDDFDFNDKAGSIIVNEGSWELCEHADFRGKCIVLNPGRYEFLNDMNNRISSVRRVR
jgi:hypothetical protein